MKFGLPLLLSALLFAYGAFGACQVVLNSDPRQGALYQSGSGWLQIYDIEITNNGDCDVGTILISTSAANLTQTWNLLPNGTDFSVTSFGAVLPPTSTVNAGFLGFFTSQSLAVSATVTLVSTYCTYCPSSSTSSSSSSATTSASSSTASSSVSTASSTSSSSTSSTGSSTSCHVSSTLTPRPNSQWQSGNGVSQIYDIVVVNDGSCGVNDITLQLSFPSGLTSSITSSWNLDAISDLQYSLTSFGDVLPIGADVNAGFILFYANTQSVPSTGVSATVLLHQCNSCSSSGSSSSSSTTLSPSSTTSSSATSSTTGPSSTCNLVSHIAARAGSSFLTGTGISQIFDFSVSNLGACAATSIDVTISTPAGGSISSSWNMQLVSGSEYSVTNFGGDLLQGQTAAAGFIALFPNTQVVPSGTTLVLSASQCSC